MESASARSIENQCRSPHCICVYFSFARHARFVTPMLVDGAVGLVLAPGGRLTRALRLVFAGGKIAAVEVIADPERLGRLELAVLDG